MMYPYLHCPHPPFTRIHTRIPTMNIAPAAQKPLKCNSDFSPPFSVYLATQLAVSKIVTQQEHNKINNSKFLSDVISITQNDNTLFVDMNCMILISPFEKQHSLLALCSVLQQKM